MLINIVTLFPQEVKNFMNSGVVGRAINADLAQLAVYNPRNYTEDFHQTVDDRPYGGGDGMILLAEPLARTIEDIELQSTLGDIYYLSPQGKTWNDVMAEKWAQQNIAKTLICGRYGGVAERFLQFYNIQEISIGDFVLSGGEIAAMAVVDSVLRKLPGVLGNSQSALEDSFSGEGLLEASQFSRPQEWKGLKVPSVLLTGNHQKILAARKVVALIKTALKRPDLVNTIDQQIDLQQAINSAISWGDEELSHWRIDRNQLIKLRENS
ncbi:MAG: tRNA (guanosine(37)-N1)-methyltransferase TrmD [Bdellovibrionales bacterium]|nr:tRNA (guanosine(37)-N1)-methyltransferase TrmD [Bdellovibrionales bacterium]